MYSCKSCGTANPLDSAFCKKCGLAIPDSELADEIVKLNSLIEEGNNLYTEGRSEEAMMIAEAAVQANPSSHLALSLKGLCHERLGQIAEALDCYEQAVALNPDGTLDKIKVNALRNRLAHRAVEPAQPGRGTAFGLAFGAVALVMAVGLGAAYVHNKPETKPLVAANSSANNVQGFSVPPAVTSPVPQNTPSPAESNPNQSLGTTVPDPNSSSAARSNIVLPPAPTDILPTPTGNSPLGGPIGLQPLNPGQPSTNPTPVSTGDPTPTPVTSTSGQGTIPKDPTPDSNQQSDPGTIEIKVAKNPTNPYQPGSQFVQSNSNQLEALTQTALNEFELGQYKQALGTYSKLASGGGNGPLVQQRIAQCYDRLGQTNQARIAYNRAINGYQSALKTGKNVAANTAGLNSCLQALKVLGG